MEPIGKPPDGNPESLMAMDNQATDKMAARDRERSISEGLQGREPSLPTATAAKPAVAADGQGAQDTHKGALRVMAVLAIFASRGDASAKSGRRLRPVGKALEWVLDRMVDGLAPWARSSSPGKAVRDDCFRDG